MAKNKKDKSAEFKAFLDLQKRKDEEIAKLLKALHERLPNLRELLASVSDHWGYEDPIYRFYHQSFKVYRLQHRTEVIVKALQELAPHLKLNGEFARIIAQGTGKQFVMTHNKHWPKHTRPMVEAFFHARYMLEMAVRYGELTECPSVLPSGFAAFLYLYDLR